MPIVRLDNVSLSYGLKPLLNHVTLQLRKGERVCLLGRNGVGKSTLVSTIAGRSSYRSGSITMRGERIERQPSHLRCRAGIGLVPQEREIFP